ncbi:MAG: polysaccharide biosynthesis protein PslH [Solirubrobacteraceae bacterium]|nr:polysaccharide biosynthesis protein PslH [Solirubrobacteraceae bacterium]
MSDLYISAFAPTLGSGRALRTYTCIRALAMLGPVDLAYVPHGADEPSPEYLAIDGLRFHEIRPSRGVRRLTTYASMRLRGVPDAFARGISPEIAQVAERLAAAPGRGRVIVGDTACAVAMLRWARRHPLIYNAHNIESSYSYPNHGDRLLNRLELRHTERRVLRSAAESWMVSREDLAQAGEMVPGARLRYVPNVVDVHGIRPAPERRAGGRRVLMLADFDYPPNRQGLRFLVDEVLPRVWRELPDARLTLAGRGLEAWPGQDERIAVAGYVDDLAATYAAADCVAVPLLESGGTPLKFVEALAYGVPVVATSPAARGLEVRPGEHFLAGDGADAFAARVVEVLGGGAPGIAVRGRALAEAEYSVQALADRIAGR